MSRTRRYGGKRRKCGQLCEWCTGGPRRVRSRRRRRTERSEVALEVGLVGDRAIAAKIAGGRAPFEIGVSVKW